MALEKYEGLDLFFRFAFLRQEIMLARVNGDEIPISDETLLTRRYTNVYRAADRVSQYLINEIQPFSYGIQDQFYRTLLFKMFNSIETWKIWENAGYSHVGNFQWQKMQKLLPEKPFRGAYISAYATQKGIPGYPPAMGSGSAGVRCLQLLDWFLMRHYPEEMASPITDNETGYQLLISAETIGKFLAYQFLTDLGYSEQFDFPENDFVKAGPGSRFGIQQIMPKISSYEGTIKTLTENWDEEMHKRQIPWRSLYGRAPHLIDVQNVFCEIGKLYRTTRLSNVNGGQIRKYTPGNPHHSLMFPEKWNINGNLNNPHWGSLHKLGMTGMRFKDRIQNI